ETEDPGSAWVWDIAGRDGQHTTTSGDAGGEDEDGEDKNE
ncbi:unnamed protein product, partial [Ectocarpus sp. 13 AM-2016]